MSELSLALLLLFLFQIKHWYVDFVLQTDYHVKHKGIYGHPGGLWHSVHHGIATILVLVLFVDIVYALIAAILDTVVHYHIDWVKMNYGSKDISSKNFWNHLGLDQMAHQITYILLVFFLLI